MLVSNTGIAVKGKQKISSSQNFFLCKLKYFFTVAKNIKIDVHAKLNVLFCNQLSVVRN
jgi:hypothetical protein